MVHLSRILVASSIKVYHERRPQRQLCYALAMAGALAVSPTAAQTLTDIGTLDPANGPVMTMGSDRGSADKGTT
jgi:hypothetical protein